MKHIQGELIPDLAAYAGSARTKKAEKEPMVDVTAGMEPREPLYGQLDSLTLVTLQSIASLILGPGAKKLGAKANYLLFLSNYFSFKDQAAFDAFFQPLDAGARYALEQGTFREYVPLQTLEKSYGIETFKTNPRSYGSAPLNVEDHQFFSFFVLREGRYLYLPQIFRDAFRSFLPLPEAGNYDGTETIDRESWSAEASLFDTLPLMLGELGTYFRMNPDKSREEVIRKGVNKTDLKRIRPLCGMGEFPLSRDLKLDPIDLFFRLHSALRPDAPGKDALAWLKNFMDLYFQKQYQNAPRGEQRGASIEFHILNEHLSIRPTNDVHIPAGFPNSRTLFHQILKDAARSRRWYGVEDLYLARCLKGAHFFYANIYTDQYGLRCKASRLKLGVGQYIEGSYDEYIYVLGPQRHALLGLPLFKAYWYSLAILGLVEITEKAPAQTLEKNGKWYPVSPYDCLDQVRVTALGRYCLGLQKEYQVQAADTYEAIADSELLLVTFRGHSLGRKLFLEQIGTPLGQDRYRISEASFVDACPNPRELERRIKKFLTLIEPKPSPRWLAFFEGLRQRAALLSRQERMVVFTLDPRSQAVKDLFAHPKLRRLIAKAEGNRILVSLENHGKFVKIAREEGFYAD